LAVDAENTIRACRDSNGDGCNDCNSGSDDPNNDGIDFDEGGFCAFGDTDDDNDGVPNAEDGDPFDPFVCRRADGERAVRKAPATLLLARWPLSACMG
jgi:hypothetical protein